MQFRNIHWFVLITMLLHLAVSLFLPLFVDSLFGQIYLGQIVFLVMGGLFLISQKKDIVTYARLNLPPWWSFIVVFPVVIATIVVSNFVTILSVLVTRSLGLIDMPPQELIGLSGNHLLLVVTFSLLPGIVEEFYCRGVLLPAYEETVSTGRAIVISSLMFGLMHFNMWNILSPMVLGVVFSLLTIRFQSIIPAMFGHALFNLLILGIQKLQLSEPAAETVVTWHDLIGLIPVTALSGLALGWLFWRLGTFKAFQPAKRKLTLLDHLPAGLIILLFLAVKFFILKGLSQ